MAKTKVRLIKLDENNALAFDSYIISGVLELLLTPNVYGIGAVCEDSSCGALIMQHDKPSGIMQIKSLYVDESVRSQGIGSLLLNAAKALAASRRCRSIEAEYPFPKLRDMELYLEKHGFIDVLPGNAIYRIPIPNLVEYLKSTDFKAPLSSDFLTLDSLSKEDYNLWMYRFGKDIPEYLSPKEAGGKLLPDESLLYVKENTVKAFVLVSELEDGCKYIPSLFFMKNSVKPGFSMLMACLNGICRNAEGNGTLCLSGASEEGKQLINHFIEGHEGEIDMQVMHTASYIRKGADIMAEIESRYPSMEVLVPRLRGLEIILKELNISGDILVTENHYPSLIISDESDEVTMKFTYIPLDASDEDRFMLYLSSEIAVDASLYTQIQLICDEVNAISFATTFMQNPRNNLILAKASMPETGSISDVSVFETFIDAFNMDMAMFRERLVPISNNSDNAPL